tara:strand:+ start:674 stop:835 length:162 start_codon:yes stop_codon:yes gene_type:complete
MRRTHVNVIENRLSIKIKTQLSLINSKKKKGLLKEKRPMSRINTDCCSKVQCE